MKCIKQFRGHKLPISSLWEVQLDDATWKRVKGCAFSRKATFSWITRYCVFCIVREKELKMTTAMEKLSSDIKHRYRQKSISRHRHILCLYGDDEKLIRIAAMELNITVSHLIRIALDMYLPQVEKRSFEWRYIYYYGTKLAKRLNVMRVNYLDFPDVDTIFYEKWPYKSWWRRPWGKIIQIPYRPDQPAA